MPLSAVHAKCQLTPPLTPHAELALEAPVHEAAAPHPSVAVEGKGGSVPSANWYSVVKLPVLEAGEECASRSPTTLDSSSVKLGLDGPSSTNDASHSLFLLLKSMRLYSIRKPKVLMNFTAD